MITIKGSNAGSVGFVELSGAKNSILPVIAAACICDGNVIIHNAPIHLNDVQVMINVLNHAGFKISIQQNDIVFDNSTIDELDSVLSDDTQKIRYSLLMLSIFLCRTGCVSMTPPGGCNLGDRKYDIHLDSLRKMGAIIEEDGRIRGRSANGLHGDDLHFRIATTSGSENVIIAACRAEGITRIYNANTRPEVIELIEFLRCAGADISYSTRYVEVRGVKKLTGCEYSVMPDRHEALTYMLFAAITRGEICIKNFNTKNIEEDVRLLREIGVNVFEWSNNVYVSAKNRDLKPFSLCTSPYPGINSDTQPLFAALAATIPGESIITDTRFPDRFQYVDEFVKMGIDIKNYENCAIVNHSDIIGNEVVACDLRAGAALMMLGCVAKGVTKISNEYQIKRGYQNLTNSFRELGFEVEETSD